LDLFTLSGLLPALLVTIIALACAQLFVRNLATTATHEFAAIDGLRGLLALAVFLHHSIYWYSYATGGKWYFYSSSLYMNFGHVSVNIFFMLTGFLFTLKLLDGREREIDWLKLYCSRLMRLTPLYFCLLIGICTIVAAESHFKALESTENILAQLRSWLLFVIPGKPDINTFADTQLITAGVVWTLPYEWYFYFLLPVLGLLLGTKNRGAFTPWLILSAACVLGFSSWDIDLGMFYYFGTGGLTALIVRTPWLRKPLKEGSGNFAIIACLIIGYACIDNYMSFPCLFVVTTAFILIACGNNIFGLLTSRAARALSCASYGIYLLQGIVLYIIMMYGLEADFRHKMTIHQFWLLICLVITPILVGMSAFTWHFVESPAISASPKLADWLRKQHSASKLLVTPRPQIITPTLPAIDLRRPDNNDQSKESLC